MEPVNRTSESLRGLVSDLDNKLATAAASAAAEPVAEPDVPTRRSVPTWLSVTAVTVLGIALAVLIVQPWKERCTYATEVCQIAQLDIDALRITIPDSELIAILPNIDALDPNDELTAGDIFAMERFAHLNFEELLTADEINRLLGESG